MAAPINANEHDFGVLSAYLDATGASDEVRAALDGLRRRYELGKEMNALRQQAYREMQARAEKAEEVLVGGS